MHTNVNAIAFTIINIVICYMIIRYIILYLWQTTRTDYIIKAAYDTQLISQRAGLLSRFFCASILSHCSTPRTLCSSSQQPACPAPLYYGCFARLGQSIYHIDLPNHFIVDLFVGFGDGHHPALLFVDFIIGLDEANQWALLLFVWSMLGA